MMKVNDISGISSYYEAMSTEGSVVGKCSMKLPPFDISGMRVLDVFCRGGKGACKLAEAVGPSGQVVGIDPDEGFVLKAKRYAHDAGQSASLTVLRAFPECLSGPAFLDGSFDLIYVNSAINLTGDILCALAEFRRVLARDGALWVAEGVFAGHGPVGSGSAASPISAQGAAGVFGRAVRPTAFRDNCLQAGFRSCEFGVSEPIVANGADALGLAVPSGFLKMDACVRKG
jgi:arsenite methyltransferase